jgi:uncharacterized protein (TIGR03790 family)
MESVPVLSASTRPIATLSMPRSGILPSEIAVLINDNDPQSVEVANYYQEKRGIPSQNMIHLNFDQNKIYPGLPLNNYGIDPADFAALKAQADAAAGPNIQAFVLTWTKPYSIAAFNYYTANYSITSAFTFGIDADYLAANSCGNMPINPYYDSASTRPYSDYKIRPTMMLAGTSAANVKVMIDKAVMADRTLPRGNGWFVNTADAARSGPRSSDFRATVQAWNRPEALSMHYYDHATNGGINEVTNTKDILFYETGLARANGITSNTYLPGAVADHLTSSGGVLFGTDQMSVLRWLEAGLSASYGTVTEPCAYSAKFPQASVLVKNYFLGNTVNEAYLKSVQSPAQGVFVGDPLTRPFGTRAALISQRLTIATTILAPGKNYVISAASSASGPFTQVAKVSAPDYQHTRITVPHMGEAFYKLEADALQNE